MPAIWLPTKSIRGKRRTRSLCCRTPVLSAGNLNHLAAKKTSNVTKRELTLNDSECIESVAYFTKEGDHAPKDDAKTKALELYCRAAELGLAKAYREISDYYHLGDFVEKNEHRATAFLEVAAKKGHIPARHNLGVDEELKGNHALAIRHYKISAEAGVQLSLDALKVYVKANSSLLGNDEFAKILRKFLSSKAEMKTDQRDAWAKHIQTSDPTRKWLSDLVHSYHTP